MRRPTRGPGRRATRGFRDRAVFCVLVLTPVFLLAGCGGATGGLASPANAFDVLTGDEVRAEGVPNLYEAVQHLRPQWLRPRPRTSISFDTASEPVVYVQGLPHGSADTMYSMHVNEVVRVEYINPLDATTRYGTGHGGGVILVDLARE